MTGLGFSLVCAPFLIAVLGPREGVRTALVLSSLLNVALLVRTHRSVLWRSGSLLAVPAVASTPLLAWCARRIDGRVLAASAGVLTVVSALALWSGFRWRRAATSVVAACFAGVVSAAMNVVGSIGGPALALYTVNAEWPPERTRPTLQVIFLLSNVVALVSLGLPAFGGGGVGGVGGGGGGGGRWAAFVAALVVGWLVGLQAAGRVPASFARAATLSVAAAGGALAVVRAL